MSQVTQILSRIEAGEKKASEELLPLVYNELRQLAAARMTRERSDHTLQATALVHEAYVRLVDSDQVERWDSRGHFFSAAAQAMQRILVESARAKQARKRGGDRERVSLDDGIAETIGSDTISLVELSDAIERMSDVDSKAAELTKLRLFAGLSVTEAGDVLGMSKRVAYENWDFVRAWFIAQFK